MRDAHASGDMVHITAITFIAAIVDGALSDGFASITVPFALRRVFSSFRAVPLPLLSFGQ